MPQTPKSPPGNPARSGAPARPGEPTRHGAPVRPVSKPVTGILIETVLRRCMGAFCLVFGAQSLPFIFGQHVLPTPWKIVVVSVLYGSFAAIALLGLLGRSIALVSRFVTIAYLAALGSWPVVARDPHMIQPHVPWLWYLCSLSMAAAVFGFSTWIAAVYIVVVPLLFSVVRQTPSGGGGTVWNGVLEGTYAFVLGLAVLILVVLLRRAADSVDAAQAAAVTRYGEAVRQHAMEVERVEVDSILHDGVLTTLLSAAKAEIPAAQQLAARMAEISIERIREAADIRHSDDAPVTMTALQQRLVDELARLDPQASITPARDIPAMLLPAEVAETLSSAATQALVNSCQHAGEGASRQVGMRVVEGVAEISIVDNGAGFDTSRPSDRLGVRVSILERVANAGGEARIRSTIGAGTIVTLRWASESRALTPLRA